MCVCVCGTECYTRGPDLVSFRPIRCMHHSVIQDSFQFSIHFDSLPFHFAAKSLLSGENECQ